MTNTQKTITAVAVAALLFGGVYWYKKKPLALPTPPKDAVADTQPEKDITPIGVVDPEPVETIKPPIVTPINPIVPTCKPWTDSEVALVLSGVGRFSPDFYDNRCDFPAQTPISTGGKDINQFYGNETIKVDLQMV